MTKPLRILAALVLATTLAACAGAPTAATDQLTDAQRQECAALRGQHIEQNKAGVIPSYCTDAASIQWTSEPKDPIKLDFKKDTKTTP